MKRRPLLGSLASLAAVAAAPWAGGCVSIGSGEAPLQSQLELHDAGAAPPRRAAPLVPALLLAGQSGHALADSTAIAYATAAHVYASYQHASWSERPVRRIARLLQQRLEARGVAGAVGLLGDPMRADWLLTVVVDEVVHDLPAGAGRVALAAELYDRGPRQRLARRGFVASARAARADAPAAAAALSSALGRVFDELQPWLEAELQRAAARR